jgi:prephenate dehydrogenase
MLFRKATIAGLGLIGGSLALAARRAGLFGEVVGLTRSRETLDEALRLGMVDRGSLDPAEASRDADLLLLAVPVRSIVSQARQCLPFLAAGAVITDAGSVKAPIMRELSDVPAFVGGHPIAGSEKSGPQAADSELFQDHLCILTPGEATAGAATDRIQALWEAVGMRVERMSPERHDEIVAAVSHLPNAVGFALVNAVLDSGIDLRYGAGSLHGATRVAASSVEMWQDILLANAELVDAALGRLGAQIESLRAAVRRGDQDAIAEFLTRAARARRQWRSEP